ncbi:hypothetical protein ACFSE1_00675 [Rhizobium helianthi]|uniref:Uncharacterized protein n=1 Tax=Rhizobium helianthi TaxID=1132695 RepID=A0ABW4M0N1_9HYPH
MIVFSPPLGTAAFRSALVAFLATPILGLFAAGAVVTAGLALNSAGRWFALLRLSELDIYLVALAVFLVPPQILFCTATTLIFLFQRRALSRLPSMGVGAGLCLISCVLIQVNLAPNARISEVALFLAACAVGGAVSGWVCWRCLSTSARS